VFDSAGNPVPSLVIELGGTFIGQTVRMRSITGSAGEWGPAGFEFTLATGAQQGNGDLWVQVFDLDNQPLSDRIRFNTEGDCEHNLTVLNFVETGFAASLKDAGSLFLPVIFTGHNSP
jgi:hypothetical protein